MSLRVSYKKQILLGIMLLLVVFVLVEGFSQVYYFFTPLCHIIKSDIYKDLDTENKRALCDDMRQIMYTNGPFRQMLPNQHYTTVNINEHGFRGDEVTKEKADNTYRVFLVGGSTAFGTGSTSDDTTITEYLQKKFDEKELPFKVEVINAGIPGAFSATEVHLIKEKLLSFEPDLFIIYDGFNDIRVSSSLYEPDPEESDNKTNLFSNVLRSFILNTKSVYVIHFLVDDYLTNVLDSYVRHPFDSTEIEKKSLIWQERWNEICMLGKKKGFDVIVTIQPILGSSDRPLTPFEQKYFVWRDAEEQLPALELYAKQLEGLNSSCTKTKDLRNIFDGIKDPIYIDSGHYGNYGNEIIANRLFEISLPIVEESYAKVSNFGAQKLENSFVSKNITVIS